jgi:acetyl esterase/lipase
MSNEQNPMAGPGTDAANTAMLVGMATILGGKQPQEFSVNEQRSVFQQLQADPKEYNGVVISHEVVSTSHGDVKAFLYKPAGKEDMPFVYFIHGGGFIFGGAR